MNVYASVADSAQTVKQYQQLWSDRLLSQTNDPVDAAELQRHQQILLISNQNLNFANDVMSLILKNISSLQP